MLEAFVSKFILYVYKNVKWNQRKIAPIFFFVLKVASS